MAIRPATIDDAEAIVEVHIQSWKWAYQGVVPEELMKRVEDPGRIARVRQMWDPNRVNLVSLDDQGAIVAFARENLPPGLDGYDCEIGSLYAHPGHARHGHGRALVRAMAATFAERGDVSLCIHTLKNNRIGRSFYERIGGTLVKEDKWEGLDAVWYGWPDVATLAQKI